VIIRTLRTKPNTPRRLILAILLTLGLSWALTAQVDRTSLTGTVEDASGRAVPGAGVSVTQLSTGLTRSTISDSLGAYTIADLPAGFYRITVRKAGFQELTYESVEQAVGATRTLNPVLRPSDRNESVTITATVSELDQTSAALSGEIEQRAILDLPLNGRNWASLTAFAPGAIDSGGSNQRSIRFVGRGRDDYNTLLDGVDATGIVNQSQKANIRLAIPTESIAEFRVNSTLSPAEYGDAAGAQIAVASASGSNRFHGSLFEFVRNSFFDARSPFDTTTSPHPFHMNQFGAAVGGPIRPNKTFFFFNYEGIRQLQEQTEIGFVPSAAFRAQTLALYPVLAPIINAFPAGNGTTTSTGVTGYTGTGRLIQNEDAAILRIDHRFSDNSTGFLRFNNDSATSYSPLGVLTDRQKVITKPRNGVAEFLHVFSPGVLNEAKFGFNQAISQSFNLTAQPYTTSIPSFSALNGYSSSDSDGTTFSWLDNFDWVKGRHTIKFGVEVKRVQINEGNSATTTLTYASLSNFQNNFLDSAAVLATLPLKRLRKTQEFAFAQDEIKLKPNLTLNIGLRYQFFSVFHESDNRDLPFDFATCGPGGYCPATAPFYFPKHDDLDPRLGMTWSPVGSHGKTVLRAGAGLYHEDGQLDDQNFPEANDEPRYSLARGAQFPTLSFPVEPFLVNATGVLSPKDLIRDRKDAYVSEWSVSVQQSLSDSMMASVSYVGSKGTDIMNRAYINTLIPGTNLRPYPAFGQIEIRGNNSNSEFHGLETSIQRRFKSGLLFSLNYMWSHALNDASLGSGVEDVFPENVNCRRCEHSSSDQDARQSLSAYAVYELPFGAGKHYLSQPGAARFLLGGWQLNGVLTGRTGLPVNVTVTRASSALPDGNAGNQRPDLVPGVSLTPPNGSTPTNWINIAAFSVPANGTWGNAGRNLITGPALWQFDTAISRRFALRERVSLEFRGECFNLFNRAQFGNPAANISAPSSFGVITTLVNTTGPTGSGTPREFQLAARVIF
jgi:Carboxypeptidase regulatory-like domain/TonB dependent receptor